MFTEFNHLAIVDQEKLEEVLEYYLTDNPDNDPGVHSYTVNLFLTMNFVNNLLKFDKNNCYQLYRN